MPSRRRTSCDFHYRGRRRSSRGSASSATGEDAAAVDPPLPDLYIGAHAAVAGLVLLTRDATRYRTYFPGLEIIAP
jgi:predicted nucleic acid-binding protein